MPGESSLQTNAQEAARLKPPPPGRFQCTECQKSFGRVEHLTRHSQSHSRDRSHKCSHCRKGFYRLDALIRHEKIHQNLGDVSPGKSTRACLACSTARRKCSRGLPCSACIQRSIDCIFPSSSVKNPEGRESEGWQDQAPSSGNERMGSAILSNPWSNVASQPAEISERLSCDYRYSPAMTTNDRDQTGTDAVVPDQHSANRPSSASVTNTANEGGFDSGDHQALWNPNETLANFQTGWPDNNFSSINWLPDNWTPRLEHAEVGSFNSLTQSIDMGGNSAPPQPQPNEMNDVPADQDTVDSGRHWVQTNTPRDSITSGETSSTPHSQPSTGRLYVDGDGSRMPRVRKAPYEYDETQSQTLEQDYRPDFNALDIFWFPDLDSRPFSFEVPISQTAQVTHDSYDRICEAFRSTCITSSHFRPYYASNFPSVDFLSGCIQLYLLHFQPIFPFIHTVSFRAHSIHWLLNLAMAAIGCSYIGGNQKDITQCSLAMLEFLRRGLLSLEEGNQAPILDPILSSQIRLLSCIGSMYSGNEKLHEAAEPDHGKLVGFCRTTWVQQDLASVLSVESAIDDNLEDKWKLWHVSESRRRIGYCIWLLDCMWAFHFQSRPLLALEDATVPIPCQEVLWEADSALDWQQLYTVATAPNSLHLTIQKAYIDKQFQSSTGEFSRILCIHALFQRTWDVETYYKKPLTVWSPTAERQDSKNILESLPLWLPGIPVYSKWRNSACDVLDILHWHANSVIGAASGMEHPTVLHLHFARVVLLTPFREILKLVHLLTGSEIGSTSDEILRLKNHLQRWALEDQYKARLAMIHAGVLFWHVRRYSTDAFYEPSSVFLASLALWAYGTFAPRTPAEDPNDEGQFPTSMQLDRPADDELVQLFVKRGAVMKANITGVGNLCSEKGHRRVLVEGTKLLKGLKKWGIAHVLAGTLTALIAELSKLDFEETL